MTAAAVYALAPDGTAPPRPAAVEGGRLTVPVSDRVTLVKLTPGG